MKYFFVGVLTAILTQSAFFSWQILYQGPRHQLLLETQNQIYRQRQDADPSYMPQAIPLVIDANRRLANESRVVWGIAIFLSILFGVGFLLIKKEKIISQNLVKVLLGTGVVTVFIAYIGFLASWK